MQALYNIKKEVVEELSEQAMIIGKGLAAIGRSLPVIGNAVEGGCQVASGVSRFMQGDRKGASKELMKGLVTFTGVDAQMVTDNVKEVRTALRDGGIVLGASAAVLGIAEVAATVVLGSQFAGACARESLRHGVGLDCMGSQFLASRTAERTFKDVDAAKDCISGMVQRAAPAAQAPAMR